MNGRSIAPLLAVLGSSLFLACGGKSATGTGTPTGGAATDPPPGGFETPPTTFEQPPTTNETPPVVNQNPPVMGGSGPSGSGSVSATCVQLCNTVASLTCQGVTPTPDELAACPSECATGLGELAPCDDEFAAALSCLFGAGNFQSLFEEICTTGEIGEIDPALVAACQGPATAFAECTSAIDPDPPTPTCTEADYCEGCTNTCDLCLCSLAPDTTACADICLQAS